MKWICPAVCILVAGLLNGCSGSPTAQVEAVKTPDHLQGVDALLYATQGGDIDTVASVLSQDPSLISAQDGMGNTLLHIAAGYNRAPVVKFLLEQGADPSIENYDGLNCFDYADSENADSEVLDLLRP